MKLVLAEKPSVARDIAKAFAGAKQSQDHIRAGEYVITWAVGHLLQVDDSIAPQKWDMETLPIFPEKFVYKPTNKQFSNIKKLLAQAQEVIIATDAGREGELIARLILLHGGWKKWDKTYRLWTSSALTPTVVKQAFKSLKPAKDFDSLYYSALARQHADWMVGINLTRLATLLFRDGLWSVGRVQTPTLALVVKRTIERENFTPEPYYVVKAYFSKGGKTYEGTLLPRNLPDTALEDNEDQDSGFRLSEEKAKQVVEELKAFSFGKVKEVKSAKKREQPPKLFSLTSLQRRANELFGWSASKTLAIAQKLYEEYKCISYPRTDAEHLAEENADLVKEVLQKLDLSHLIPKVDGVGKRVFDRTKLTDHHAIIPLDRLRNGEADEAKLYELIVSRFKAVFMDDFEYESVKVITAVGKYNFVSLGRKVIKMGWREIEGLDGKETDLGFLKEGDGVKKENVKMLKRFTQPPPAYTEGTLLKEMERLGLGTPATRSSIIDTLKERKYVAVLKKSLVATEKGKALVELLKGSQAVEPEMTTEWEKKLESIYKERKGKEGYERFLEEIKEFVKAQVNSLKGRRTCQAKY